MTGLDFQTSHALPFRHDLLRRGIAPPTVPQSRTNPTNYMKKTLIDGARGTPPTSAKTRSRASLRRAVSPISSSLAPSR